MFRQALTCLGIVLFSGGTAVWCFRSPGPTHTVGHHCPQVTSDATYCDDATPEDRLRTAVICNDPDAVTRLLASSHLDLRKTWGPKRLSITHYAAAGHGSVVAQLCAAGADADARSDTGETPLMYVSGSAAEQVGAVRALLAAGAALEATDDAGQTPLIHAACKGDAPLTQILLDAGADDAARDDDGHAASDFVRGDPLLQTVRAFAR